jgi:predicted nuclease of predicted toxin-antitoxin system
MRFLLDANLPRAAIASLVRFGHTAEFARDIGLGAAADTAIAAHAQNTQAVLLTRDMDFADIRRYPPDEYHGIVVLRLPDDTVAGVIALVLQRFLSEPIFVNSLAGRLAIVELDRARFRPPL